MTHGAAPIGTVVVVIPTHDEEALLEECLMSVKRAARAARRHAGQIHVRVALDACTDRSAQITARLGVPAVSLMARRVGDARRAGIAAAFRDLNPSRLDRVWTAHTDADSVVPGNWIIHQLALANQGVDVVVGTVRPDFADLTSEQIRAWKATYTPGVANGHVHGANLGVRADWLERVGGFRSVAEHEDVELVAALRCAGATIVASDEASVRTSGRPVGRTPGGYARYLREDLLRLRPTIEAMPPRP